MAAVDMSPGRKKPVVSDSHMYYSFQWEVKNFHDITTRKICTSEFLIVDTIWRLEIYPIGYDEHENFVSVYLRPTRLPCPKEVEFCIYLKLDAGLKRKLKKFTSRRVFCEKQSQGFERFIDRRELYELLGERDNFIVGVELYFVEANIETDYADFHPNESGKSISDASRSEAFDPPSYYVPQFEDKLNDPSFSDVEFKVDGQSLYATKFLLCCRSSYFRAMFQTSNMCESTQQVIQLPGFKYDAVFAVFKYIYTGCFEFDAEEMKPQDTKDIEKHSFDYLTAVYTLSDMYELPELCHWIEKILVTVVSMNNYELLLHFAYRYELCRVLAKICLFVAKHWLDVQHSETFMTLLNSGDGPLILLLFNGVMMARTGASEREVYQRLITRKSPDPSESISVSSDEVPSELDITYS
ncbi:POZ domain-containing protein [Basidiobolus meristosporus CBS 931.73]|uniref:POZ domain-containing protein n=1 Tax=Basidiobolus meristosporus CBS 931.73 TaxID=1314790 RepID=A0A1Y1Z4N0_9FUNG|nr:POZ domain-containing protein [Basidiobolus meristosporus CBS 931.73]|eukprot:ORY05252.1 POZ domain-containing protein [Basidiobolus meristosporus CBS 931.73]